MHDSNPKFGHWLLEGLGTQVIDPSGLPSTIYGELRNTSLTASVKFIAQRYKAAPVKTGLKAIRVPDSENCPKCDANMKVRYRIENMFDIKIRILWECAACDRCEWRQYENGKQRAEKG
jgi:hypothetical protein